jgi:DNA-directed RNA polymerase beta subunit
MSIHRYNLNDFVTIQRQSFFELLEKGIIEEFSKRSAVTNIKKDLKFQFYPQYYVLTPPEYTPQEAIIKNKSYTCKLFIPAQLINLKTNKKVLKWFYIGNLPLMTKRGHFILNGATRVIVNQILRSPGIYYQQKLYENYEEKWSQKPDDSYKRFYADLICMRGTWLRIEIDKYKNIWAQTKKGAKIPIYWLLVAMGLSEKKIFKTITDSYRLLGNLSNNLIEPTPTSKGLANPLSKETKDQDNESVIKKSKKQTYIYVKNPLEAWQEIFKLVYSITPSNLKTNSNLLKNNNVSSDPSSNAVDVGLAAPLPKKGLALGRGRGNPEGVTKPKVPRSAPTLGSLAPGGSPCRAAKPEGTSELNKIYEVNFISNPLPLRGIGFAKHVRAAITPSG